MPVLRSRPPTGRAKLEILRSEALSQLPWLVHGFSTRIGGVSEAYGGHALNLGYTAEDSRANVERNRAAFFRELGTVRREGKPWAVISLRQIHSSAIHAVGERPRHILAGDGLITTRRGILIGIRTADCLPILLADKKQRAVGALHAGWRGTLARIAEKGVGEMRRQYGSRPQDLVAAIGPGIHRCCYAVGEEVREQFASQFAYADALFEEVFDSEALHLKYPLLFLNQRAPGHGEPPRSLHLDLAEANRRQLLEAGVPEKNLTISELCTACRTDLLFSYRKERGVTGRMVAVIGVKADLAIG